MIDTIVWIGPLLKESCLANRKAVSPAANVWQNNFIKGLNSNGIKVISISYMLEPSWPNGQFWVPSHDLLLKNDFFEQKSIGYINLAFLRELSISFAIFLMFIKIERSKISSCFTYNPLLRHVLVGLYIKYLFNKKWVSIIADDVKKSNPDFNLFLSYNYFMKSKGKNKIFCDGGIPQTILINKQLGSKANIKSIVYSGSINDWTGIFELVKMFGNIKQDNYCLNIYGKGEVNNLRKMVRINGFDNVSVHGFVENEILYQAMESAFLFINPRNIKLKNSENNFPSKLLLYMSYEKPIIATFSPGLSPEIRKVLLEYKDEDSFCEVMRFLEDKMFYDTARNLVINYKIKNSWKEKTGLVLNKIEEK